MTHLRLVSRRPAALIVLSLAAGGLVASTARAQVPAPPAQQSGDVYVVVPPPAAYSPVRIAELPGAYGAGYGEQAPNQRSSMLQQELVSVQAQYSQYSLGAPIALVSVGGATMGISAAFFLAYLLGDLSGSAEDFSDERLVSGMVWLLGVVVIVAGLVWMFSRIRERRPYGRRIKEIKQELAIYGVRASLDVRPMPSGAVLTGTFAF